MDAAAWSQVNSELNADRNYFYVGLHRIDDTMSPDGQRAKQRRGRYMWWV